MKPLAVRLEASQPYWFQFAVSDARPSAPATILSGLSAVSTPLDPFGLPGCTQYVDAVATRFALTGNTGSAQHNFTLPNNPASPKDDEAEPMDKED